MKRCLIFITRNYPHEKGEPFIENEISSLNKHFDEVLLISSLTSSNPNQTRMTPSDVHIEYNSKIPFVIAIMKNCYKSLFWKDFFREVKDERRILNNFRRIAKCAAFSSVPEVAANNIWEKIKGKDFKVYDEIVIYSYWFHYTASIALKIKTFLDNKNIKVISRAHRYDLYEYADQDNYIPFRNYLLERIDKVVSISDNGEQYLKNKYPDYEQKISCSRLGVPDRGVNPYEKIKEFHIVSCSRLESVKRVDLIIDILSKLNSNNRIKWTHFGDGSLFKDISTKAKGLTDNITPDFKGNKLNEELMEFYKNTHVDLFINVSSSEGIPVSIMEAQSFGIPVIATNVGGTAEIVESGINGYLIEKDFEIELVVNHIQEIMNMSNENCKLLRNNSRNLWKQNFNSDKNYKNFINELLIN